MTEEKKEIRITYETIYELMRREKGRDELQKLSASFYTDLLDYLKEKHSLLEDIKRKCDIFSAAQRERLELQIKNIRKVVKDLFEKRESKVISMAVNKSRTNSNIVDTTNLLSEEKLFYHVLVDHFSLYREGLLHSVLSLNPPVSLTEKRIETAATPKAEQKAGEKKLVRFLQSVDRFVGEELEAYGPFEEDDTAYLPTSLADVLVSKEKAEEVKEQST